MPFDPRKLCNRDRPTSHRAVGDLWSAKSRVHRRARWLCERVWTSVLKTGVNVQYVGSTWGRAAFLEQFDSVATSLPETIFVYLASVPSCQVVIILVNQLFLSNFESSWRKLATKLYVTERLVKIFLEKTCFLWKGRGKARKIECNNNIPRWLW